jgi:hypothetical protein
VLLDLGWELWGSPSVIVYIDVGGDYPQQRYMYSQAMIKHGEDREPDARVARLMKKNDELIHVMHNLIDAGKEVATLYVDVLAENHFENLDYAITRALQLLRNHPRDNPE